MPHLDSVLELIDKAGEYGSIALLKGAAALLALEITERERAMDAVPLIEAPRKGRRGGRRKKATSKQTPVPPPATNGASAAASNVISHNGKSITVRPKEAACFAVLERAKPNPVGKDFLARAVWGKVTDETEILAGQACNTLGHALEPLGLKVVNTRGVGYSLQGVR